MRPRAVMREKETMLDDLKNIDGGVTAPKAFSAAGVHAGIKKKKPDLALLVSAKQANVAGVFTTSAVQAAPVKLCKERVAKGQASAVVINSGCANACTGDQGTKDAEKMAELTASAADLPADSVLVCSTGTIGVPLPMDRIEAGIRAAAESLSEDGGNAAAEAIMTTDTVSKQTAVEIAVDGTTVRIGGMAKGAGMIEPNMATMLAFITTDAAVTRHALQKCLWSAVRQSFNRITIDGDRSTNDTVLLLANGASGISPLSEDHASWPTFRDAVAEVARRLAIQLVQDGEGVTKLVTIDVTGAANNHDAHKACRAIANSPLVKTSWYGCDPNWGRIMGSLGYSGAKVNEGSVTISYDDLCAVRNGQVAAGTALKDLENILSQDRFSIKIDLGLGEGADHVYTCDCSEEYVRINSEYTT